MGGGKDSGPQYSEPVSTPDYGAMTMEMMLAMQENMAAMNAQQQESMTNLMLLTSNPPQATATPEIDWKAEDEKIRKKIATDAAAENATKRGRAQTVLTSPLTEKDVTTTSSVLTGA